MLISIRMTPHIIATRKSINFTLWNMSRIRKFIDRDSCSHAMRALVLSRLDYANSLLAGCNTGDIKRLETLQNKAARIIFRVPRLESATPLLNTLHWLPVKKRIIFKTLLYVYKVLNGLAPAYLTRFISLYTVPREGLRSAKDTLRLNVPKTQLKISDGLFSSFGPKTGTNYPGSCHQNISNCCHLQNPAQDSFVCSYVISCSYSIFHFSLLERCDQFGMALY